MAPSIMSLKMNSRITRKPTTKLPDGKKITAAALTPNGAYHGDDVGSQSDAQQTARDQVEHFGRDRAGAGLVEHVEVPSQATRPTVVAGSDRLGQARGARWGDGTALRHDPPRSGVDRKSRAAPGRRQWLDAKVSDEPPAPGADQVAPDMAPATAPRSLVWAVAGPAPIDPDDLALRLGNAAPVGMWGLASASEFAIAGAEVAVAAARRCWWWCRPRWGWTRGRLGWARRGRGRSSARGGGVGLLEAGDADDATDGSDAGSGLLWPTSPLVPAVPDFDELAVIAARMLGEERAAGVGGVRRRPNGGPGGPPVPCSTPQLPPSMGCRRPERAHRRVAGNARLRVLSEHLPMRCRTTSWPSNFWRGSKQRTSTMKTPTRSSGQPCRARGCIPVR